MGISKPNLNAITVKTNVHKAGKSNSEFNTERRLRKLDVRADTDMVDDDITDESYPTILVWCDFIMNVEQRLLTDATTPNQAGSYVPAFQAKRDK